MCRLSYTDYYLWLIGSHRYKRQKPKSDLSELWCNTVGVNVCRDVALASLYKGFGFTNILNRTVLRVMVQYRWC
ncbi:DUF3616 domain-containing protein [Plectonema radiosum]|uniref:DUF3616 domain-containing protein n=1 Tax=Plectonema radiosum TaxID=945768 RepID=UPI0035C8A836